jgi:hypothetical protein
VRRGTASLLVPGLLLLCAHHAVAQAGGFVTVGRVLAGHPWGTAYRVTLQKDLTGPFGVDGSLEELPGVRPATGDLYGAGVDLTLFAGARNLPTIFAGVAGGIGLGGQQRLWGGASLGARMPVVVLGAFRIMAEGRWRTQTYAGRSGIELALAMGFRPVRTVSGADRERAGLWVPPPIGEMLRARGIPAAKADVLDHVVSAALEEMGQPYVWGGTGNGNGGFDCSGLIQYAYGKSDLRIPRTAVGQATAGIAIGRDIDKLLPGDILVFSDRGDQPTHVGLYVGEGRFLHSASRGVRLSRLAEDDSEGRLWLRRWVGVRRIVE